jgi:hypothetical protein
VELCGYGVGNYVVMLWATMWLCCGQLCGYGVGNYVAMLWATVNMWLSMKNNFKEASFCAGTCKGNVLRQKSFSVLIRPFKWHLTTTKRYIGFTVTAARKPAKEGLKGTVQRDGRGIKLVKIHKILY